jgi:hypothetical protein
MSGDWRRTLWTLLVTFCIVIIRCTDTFWSPYIMQKETAVPVHTLKAKTRSRFIYPFVFNLSTRQSWEVSFTFRPIYHRRKSRQYEMNRRIGGHDTRSGRFGKEKNLLSMPGFKLRIVQSVALSLFVRCAILWNIYVTTPTSIFR